MAEQLVANLAEPFDAAKYTDEYRANLMKVIRAKMKGRKIPVAEEPQEEGDVKVLDLMARLQASLGRTAGKKAASKRAAGAKGAGAKGAAKKSSRSRAKKRSA